MESNLITPCPTGTATRSYAPLVALTQSGNLVAEQTLLTELDTYIVSVVRRVVAVSGAILGQAIEDLIQIGRLAAVKAVRCYASNRSSLKTWLRRCIESKLISACNQARRSHSPLNYSSQLDDDYEIPDTADPAEEALSRLHCAEMVDALHTACKDDTDRAIADCIIAGQELQSLVPVTKITAQAISARWQKIRQRTQILLEETE